MKQAAITQEKARLRAEVIMKVRCGLMTAQQAAEQLGVSRKTYYQWEERGLSCAAIEPCGQGEWPALSAGGLGETGPSAAVGAGPPGVCHFAAQDGAKGCADRVEADARDESGGKKMSASSGCSAMIAEAKTRFALPIRALAAEMRLGVATLSRWRRRLTRGQAAVGRRGPRKVKPLNLGELKERIQGLGHGGKRSRGSGRCTGPTAPRSPGGSSMRWSGRCAARPSRQRRVKMYHVCWLRPNLAWAMDDCEKTEHGAEGTLHLHNLTDLHSRYRLPPLAAERLPCGEEVAGHLQYLFERFDPPLFCKRDNGGNLNHLAVNQVLEEALVIPINSPPYRAAYNGGSNTPRASSRAISIGGVGKRARSIKWRCSRRPPPMT
jgi:hypothetical protein